MSEDLTSEATELLRLARAGDRAAFGRLVGRVYDEMRTEARRLMNRERPDHTLEPTALLNEGLLRMLGDEAGVRVADRAYFFAAVSRCMERVLIDHARQKQAVKRGDGNRPISLDETMDAIDRRGEQSPELHAALDELRELSPEQHEVIHLRYFGGYTVEEVAALRGVSVSKVEADFRRGRAFLHSRLTDGEGP